MSRNIFVFLLLAALMSGCTKSSQKLDAPEKVLSEYVARSFAMKSLDDRDKLAQLSTGQVKGELQKLDTATLQRYFVNSKKTFVSLKIRDERKLSPDRVSITYELTYMNDIPKTSNFPESRDKVTNRKHAIFVRENGGWLISEVRNEKTYIEHQNALSF